MEGYPSKVKVLAFSPNSQTLATGFGPAVLLWDFSGKGPGGKKPQALKGHAGTVTDLAFTEQRGQCRLVSIAHDGTLCTWLHIFLQERSPPRLPMLRQNA
jgi:WD40 repeat protein